MDIKRIFETTGTDSVEINIDISLDDNGNPILSLSNGNSSGEEYAVTDVENDIVEHVRNYIFDVFENL